MLLEIINELGYTPASSMYNMELSYNSCLELYWFQSIKLKWYLKHIVNKLTLKRKFWRWWRLWIAWRCKVCIRFYNSLKVERYWKAKIEIVKTEGIKLRVHLH